MYFMSLGKDRRLIAYCFAHDDIHAHGNAVIGGKYAQDELRDVHGDGQRRKVRGQPSPPFQRVVQLLDADAQRRIQLNQRVFAQPAVCSQSVPGLKMLDPVDQCTLVDSWLCIGKRALGQIT